MKSYDRAAVLRSMRREVLRICAEGCRPPVLRAVDFEAMSHGPGQWRSKPCREINQNIGSMKEYELTLQEVVESIAGFTGEEGPYDDIRITSMMHHTITIKSWNLTSQLYKRDKRMLDHGLQDFRLYIRVKRGAIGDGIHAKEPAALAAGPQE